MVWLLSFRKYKIITKSLPNTVIILMFLFHTYATKFTKVYNNGNPIEVFQNMNLKTLELQIYESRATCSVYWEVNFNAYSSEGIAFHFWSGFSTLKLFWEWENKKWRCRWAKLLSLLSINALHWALFFNVSLNSTMPIFLFNAEGR